MDNILYKVIYNISDNLEFGLRVEDGFYVVDFIGKTSKGKYYSRVFHKVSVDEIEKIFTKENKSNTKNEQILQYIITQNLLFVKSGDLNEQKDTQSN